MARRDRTEALVYLYDVSEIFRSPFLNLTARLVDLRRLCFFCTTAPERFGRALVRPRRLRSNSDVSWSDQGGSGAIRTCLGPTEEAPERFGRASIRPRRLRQGRALVRPRRLAERQSVVLCTCNDLTPIPSPQRRAVSRAFVLEFCIAWERGAGRRLRVCVRFDARKDGTPHLTDLQHPPTSPQTLSQGVLNKVRIGHDLTARAGEGSRPKGGG